MSKDTKNEKKDEKAAHLASRQDAQIYSTSQPGYDTLSARGNGSKDGQKDSDEDIKHAQDEWPDVANVVSRRKFLARVSYALGGVGAVALAVPLAGFVLRPWFEPSPPQWRKVGSIDQFKVGDTVEVKFTDSNPTQWAGPAGLTAAWLRRQDQDTFVAYSVDCTHLGCPVSWEPQSTLFFCPCHGGVYYKDGTVAAGPPPKPLPQYPVRINNGQVEIQTSPMPFTTIGNL